MFTSASSAEAIILVGAPRNAVEVFHRKLEDFRS